MPFAEQRSIASATRPDEAAALTHCDPLPGRAPSALAQALFRADAWTGLSDPRIDAALAAAAPNTLRAWQSDWQVFRRWALGRAAHWFPEDPTRVRLPILPEVLVRFVADMREGGAGQEPRAIATVRRYLSTLGALHRILDLPDPTKARILGDSLKAAARGSGGQDQAAPLRWETVESAIRVLPDTLWGLRDKTMLAVGHNAMARRGELLALRVGDVDRPGERAGEGALVALRPTKTSLEAEIDPRYLSPTAADLVDRWLARSGLREGPLFVAVHRSGRIVGAKEDRNGDKTPDHRPLAGRALDPEALGWIVKRAIALIAQSKGELILPDGERERRRAILSFARDYSGHSLRVGAAQDLAAAGISTAAILQSGGWSDERMVKRYLRKLRAQEGGMAQLFDRIATHKS